MGFNFMVNSMVKSLVCGVGVNDADYPVKPVINGRRIRCDFYRVWHGMLERCYSEKLHVRRPTYIGCAVCEDWLTFSNFKKWMEVQDWQGKQLDKDLLVTGNKIYSPETCVFVSHLVNTFITDGGSSAGEFMIGAFWSASDNKFRSECRDPFNQFKNFIGLFNSEIEAHLAWKNRKNQIARKLAENQSDDRVAAALMCRYL